MIRLMSAFTGFLAAASLCVIPARAQTLAAAGSRLVEELDALLNELRDVGMHRRGRVVMACVPSVARGLMPQCVEYCAEKWPEVTFAIEDIAASDVIAKVQRGDVEMGLSGGEIEDSELHIEGLLQDPLVLVTRREDALARRRTAPWIKLSGRRLIMLNNTSGSRQQIVDPSPAQAFAPKSSSNWHSLVQ